MLGFEATLITQAARKFESDDRAHAVTEKRERLVEISRDLTREQLDVFFDPRVGRFSHSGFSSRQQSRNDLDWKAQKLLAPLSVDRAAATSVWKTKQPYACVGNRLRLKPRQWSN